MTVNFPSSPSQGDTYTYEAITYTFDGEKWVGSTASSFNDVTISGASANVILQGNDSITTDQTFTFPNSGGEIGTGPAGYSNVGYQEGDWVPSCDQGTLAYTAANTRWIRIGNMVTVQALLYTFSSTVASTINIISLPYNCPVGQAAGSCFYQNCKVGYNVVYVAESGTYNGGIIQFYNTSTSAWDALKYSNFTGAFTVYLTATYKTDDTTWTPINGATIS